MAARRGRGRVAATVGSAPMASKLTELRPPRTPSSHNSPSRSVLGPRTLGPRDPESQGPKAQPNSASQIQESGNPPTVLISPSHSQPHIPTLQKTKTTVFTKAPKLLLTLLHLIAAKLQHSLGLSGSFFSPRSFSQTFSHVLRKSAR